MSRKENTLFRVTTPPLVRSYRKRAAQRDDALQAVPKVDAGRSGHGESFRTPVKEGRGKGPLVDECESGDDGSASPSSMTACSKSGTAFSEAALKDIGESLDMLGLSEDGLTSSSGKRFMYFDTNVHVRDLVDSSKHPPKYKEQFTVTGQIRKIKLKREGPPVGRKVEVNGSEIALFKFRGRCYAIQNSCCHQGGPLFEGDIEDLGDMELMSRENHRIPGTAGNPCVACPYHQWKFELETGGCVTSNGYKEGYKQIVYPCKIEHGKIFVGFEDFDSSAFDPTNLDF
uniref:Rieske domain-containing protein n=1 Tax=Mucochytrium quahogii TaxID=96639 RepID=A0A7S2SE80_9STRA|mmetsp:Transcript_11156/g.18222  ORF Transcript_11156/g.18222 Transcript_11156/m.18222 type:complete len:286 (+) Transcript_11156:625-1482(+)